MAIDLDRVRCDTPAAARIIHLNNAGSSLPPAPVVEAQIVHLRREAEIGGYEAEAEVQDRREDVYRSIARLLSCAPDEVALVENATVAWDMAFHSLRFQPGDRILTAQAEYASNYIAYLQAARSSGAVVEMVPSTPTGEFSVEALERMIDGRVKLIAVTHVPTNGGLVNPAAEIGRVAQANGIPFLLDACQSAGQLPLDVAAIGCDMLSATGRKYLRGPRGIGFLYVRKAMLGRLEPPFLDLHAAEWVAPDRFEMRPDARRFENWENNIAAQLGLGVAVDYALDLGLETIAARVTTLADDLRLRLAEVPGITVADVGRQRCGIVTFWLAGKPSAGVKAALAARGINCSVSGASSTLLDATARHLPDLVRASVHYYNSEDEVARVAAAVAEIARG